MQLSKFLLFTILSFLIIACTDDLSREAVTPSSSLKTNNISSSIEIENFKAAISKINKSKYLPSEKHRKKNGDELSIERKSILFEPALDLIYSVDHTIEIKDTKTLADTNEILNKAFKLYISQTLKD